MSRKGNPYDNAKAERFMRTLKEEQLQGEAYSSMAQARREIGDFLETTYNRQRLHSALGYLTPVEFERRQTAVETDGRLEGEANGCSRLPAASTVLGNRCAIPTVPTAPRPGID